MAHPNPYVAGRAASNDRYTDLAKARRNWQLNSFGLFLLLAGSMAYSFHLSSRHQVEVVMAVIDGDQIVATYRAGNQDHRVPEANLIRAELARWIRQARQMPADWTFQQDEYKALYQKTSGAAEATLTDYYRTHSPQELAQSYTVAVNVTSLLPVGEKSWTVRWQETKHEKESGKIVETKKWEAQLTVERLPFTTIQQALQNPLGLNVTSLSWAEDINR
jgi:type IV secretion system protein VirB5